MSSLYERLGATEGIGALVDTIVGYHLANPTIAKRFGPLAQDPERMKTVAQHLCDFLEEGAGGVARYTGKSMPDAHFGMNISGDEFLAAVDDIMAALEKHAIDEQTQKDVLAICYSLKPQVVRL
ncbi:MAG: group 1 truncated hemoglobin [Myxococcales bacterium]|nr:group 1 truncated hemoglobin [Myxococcales bacterium]